MVYLFYNFDKTVSCEYHSYFIISFNEFCSLDPLSSSISGDLLYGKNECFLEPCNHFKQWVISVAENIECNCTCHTVPIKMFAFDLA